MIGVVSSKGGVGKSLFSILYSFYLEEKGFNVTLVDLDVYCPNIHSIVGKKIGKKVKSIFVTYPKIDKGKCKRCLNCLRVCKANAIFIDKKGYPNIIRENCKRCFLCKEVCKCNAITYQREKVASIYKQRLSKKINLFSVKLEKLGNEREVIEFSKNFLRKFERKSKVIIDSLPGLDCNFLHTIYGLEKLFIVIEDSILGLYSLKETLKVLEKIKFGLSNVKAVINKFGMSNYREIFKFVKRKKLSFVILPYLKEIEVAYSNGKVTKELVKYLEM